MLRARSAARISRRKGSDLTWHDAPETVLWMLAAAAAARFAFDERVSMGGVTRIPRRRRAVRVRRTRLDGRDHRHARPQFDVRVLAGIERDPYRDALHDLGEIA